MTLSLLTPRKSFLQCRCVDGGVLQGDSGVLGPSESGLHLLWGRGSTLPPAGHIQLTARALARVADTRLCICPRPVSSCFHVTTAQLSSCNRDRMSCRARNVCYLALYSTTKTRDSALRPQSRQRESGGRQNKRGSRLWWVKQGSWRPSGPVLNWPDSGWGLRGDGEWEEGRGNRRMMKKLILGGWMSCWTSLKAEPSSTERTSPY